MSTFSELYSDFIDKTKTYYEKLDVTEVQFMRYITQAVAMFQRETDYIEAAVQLVPDASGNYPLPSDFSCPIDLRTRDANGEVVFPIIDFRTFERFRDSIGNGVMEGMADYARSIDRTRGLFQPGNLTHCATIYDGRIITWPQTAYPTLTFWYYPRLDSFSSTSPQWRAWFPLDANFQTMFTSSGIPLKLMEWEPAFVNYAVSLFLMSHDNANFQVYQELFMQEVTHAKELKPASNRLMGVEYKFAERS